MKLPQYAHFTRLDTLDERLTPEFIRSHLGTRANTELQSEDFLLPHICPNSTKRRGDHTRKPQASLPLFTIIGAISWGILPEGTDYKPTSPLMKQELGNWTRLPHKCGICRHEYLYPLRLTRRQGQPDRTGQA